MKAAGEDRFPCCLSHALMVCAGFAAFLVWDQWHWWSVKEDYAFGYLVPAFVAYVVYDRWPRVRALAAAQPAVIAPGWMRRVATVKAVVVLAGGLAFFAMGAFYRAGAGLSQPASLAMALGFAALSLSLVYLNGPESTPAAGGVPARGLVDGLRATLAEPRLRLAALFLFPALVWVISAPLVSAIENTISLFLLNRVTSVVFFVFDMLGLPLERQGNVLVLPHGEVGVEEACSGIRSLTGSLFAGSFLAAVFLVKLWKKVALVVAAMVL
ncbi:MAG: exosortase/archaeosortase family protein, partial [Verrucomicrobia bacterium]